MLSQDRLNQFFSVVVAAAQLGKANQADAILLLIEDKIDWKKLLEKTQDLDSTVIATISAEVHEAAVASGVQAVLLERPESSIQNQVTQALISSVANDFIPSGSSVVTAFKWFDNEVLDTISLLKLTERLGRLTASDLKKLETNVPLETLKTVVDLAVEIGREGREGNPIGTMFVVGDHRNVLKHSAPTGFDLVKGYPRKDRNLLDPKIHESVKELAQLDGTFVIAADGTIEGCGRIIDTPPVEVTMTRGLGSRHFAAAAISKNTKSIAVVVSQSGGTVRLYQDGEVVLRIESLQRAMKWKKSQTPNNSDDN